MWLNCWNIQLKGNAVLSRERSVSRTSAHVFRSQHTTSYCIRKCKAAHEIGIRWQASTRPRACIEYIPPNGNNLWSTAQICLSLPASFTYSYNIFIPKRPFCCKSICMTWIIIIMKLPAMGNNQPYDANGKYVLQNQLWPFLIYMQTIQIEGTCPSY